MKSSKQVKEQEKKTTFRLYDPSFKPSLRKLITESPKWESTPAASCYDVTLLIATKMLNKNNCIIQRLFCSSG